MANPEHLEILDRGVKVWNEWRTEHNMISPDLSDINLSNANLYKANLRETNLSGVNLSFAILGEANLCKATLRGAQLRYANFTRANLNFADLNEAILTHSLLFDADLANCELGLTILVDVDLSETRGLESVRHRLPSRIGIDTVYKSGGEIPEVFLRGCGVPEDFITFMHSLAASGKPIQFYSCFISYSSKNQIFADRLYADLQNKGVRCWLASEDLKIGDRIRIGIDESIRIHDKLLLVLSKYSVASDWVEQEVETALNRERKEKRTILFPIRLDDTVMKIDSGWPALIKNTRNIGDFRKWKNPEAYQKALERLLRDLKAEDRTTR